VTTQTPTDRRAALPKRLTAVRDRIARAARAARRTGLGAAVGDYLARVRGGDVGSLPAVLGLVVLVAVFSALRPTTFTGAFNFANLLHQSAAVIVIAMGLVFVLLLGEIDLSAGFAAGTAGAVMGIVVTDQGWPWWSAVLACLATGALIGTCIGLLVARLGIPSFVVTLAAFLGLQGVLLKLIGEGGTVPVRDDVLLAVNNSNMPVWLGWLLYAVVVGLYAVTSIRRAASRRAGGLEAEAPAVLIGKIATLAVLLGAATTYLSVERSPNPDISSIRGVPVVVAVLLALLVGLNFVLGRTALGRHIYAVGGNAEAARRAGINVRRVRLFCFVTGSTLAAVAGILLASRDNSVSPSTGGASTLLYAVGAAVIGGTSLFGGKGKVLDAILGGLVIGVIVNGMGLLNQPSSVVFMVTGVVLLVAASVDAISRRRAASSGRV
jgi:D-xylose transport system permease protein